MKHYSAYGLQIRSELDLPLPEDSAAPAQVTIRIGQVVQNLDSESLRFANWEARPEEFLLRISGVADYQVTQGREIIVNPSPGVASEEAVPFLMSSVFACLLQQRGMLTLHASAIKTPQGAVLFMGGSGSGKSTIAAALNQRTFPLISDDISPVVEEQGRLVVVPGYKGLRLWTDALEQLGKDRHSLRPVRHSLQKYHFPVTGAQLEHTTLRAIYILLQHNQEVFKIESLDGADKLDWLHRYTFRQRYLEGMGLRHQHFSAISKVATQIPMKTVTRPIHPYLLQELADLLVEDFGK